MGTQINRPFGWARAKTALAVLLVGTCACPLLAVDEIDIPGVSGDWRFLVESHQDVQQTGGYFYKNYLNVHSNDWQKEFTFELNVETRNYFNLGGTGSTYRQEMEDKIDTAFVRWSPQSDTKFVIIGGRQTLNNDYRLHFDGVRVNAFPGKNFDVGIFGGRKIQYYSLFEEDNAFGGEMGFHWDFVDARFNARKDLDKIFLNFNLNLYPFKNGTFIFREEVFDNRQEAWHLGFDYSDPEWGFTAHDIFTQRSIALSRVATALGNDAFPVHYPYGLLDSFLYKNDSQSNLFTVTKSWDEKFDAGMEWEVLLDNSETNYWAQFFFRIYDLFTQGSQLTMDINKSSEELVTNRHDLNAGFHYQFPFRIHWLFNFGYNADILTTAIPDSYKWGRVYGGIQYNRNKNYIFKLQVNNHNGDIINTGPTRLNGVTRNDNQLNFESTMKF